MPVPGLNAGPLYSVSLYFKEPKLLEGMRADAQRPETRRFTAEIVPGIPDHRADAGIAGDINDRLGVLHGPGIDDVNGISTRVRLSFGPSNGRQERPP